MRADEPAELEAIHFGHEPVRDDHSKTPGAELLKGGATIWNLDGLVTTVPENRSEHRSGELIVVHYKHSHDSVSFAPR